MGSNPTALTMQIITHLITGEIIESREEEEVTAEEAEEIKIELQKYCQSSKGWQFTMSTKDDRLIMIPGHSILYLDIIT